jgi:hypothetical protein
MLKKLCSERDVEWDVMLPYVLFAYREVPHEETGYSPFELLYGWPVRGPTQILKDYMFALVLLEFHFVHCKPSLLYDDTSSED